MRVNMAMPRIAILMATYKPRQDWLREQLRSLNEQTYPNLYLYLRDDCSGSETFEQIREAVRDCITAFPFEIRRNEENLGSNRTFELLTQEAEGDFFAYCDQDDIWLPEKLSRYEERLRDQKDALLVCSDMYIIDGSGKTVASSMTSIRRHHRFLEGSGLAPKLIFSNFVTGCAMMIRSEWAKAAVPFCPYMVHDQYLAFFCARRGEIALIRDPLIRYRVHGDNQTRDMAGVEDKESYYRHRIVPAVDRLRWLNERFADEEELRETLQSGLEWVEARERCFRTGRGAGSVWKGREHGKNTALFEMAGRFLPDRIFMKVIELKRQNRI